MSNGKMCLHLELKTIGNTLFIIKTQKKDFAIANSHKKGI